MIIMRVIHDCSHEIRNSYDKPGQCIKKERHHFANKGPESQSYGFSSSHGCENWSIKKAESRRIDAFELWCWRGLLKEFPGQQGDQTSQS